MGRARRFDESQEEGGVGHVSLECRGIEIVKSIFLYS
jgi:hypothetical protein